MNDEPSTDEAVDPSEMVLDGNAAAGLLASLFGEDVTVVPGRCDHCGTVSMIGAMRAYVRAPGTVVRFEVWRNRQRLVVPVEVGQRPNPDDGQPSSVP